jgi:hypothetical protein
MFRYTQRQGIVRRLELWRLSGNWGRPLSIALASLKYATNLGGYRTGITENQLKGAPKYGNDNAWNWNDPARARR